MYMHAGIHRYEAEIKYRDQRAGTRHLTSQRWWQLAGGGVASASGGDAARHFDVKHGSNVRYESLSVFGRQGLKSSSKDTVPGGYVNPRDRHSEMQ